MKKKSTQWNQFRRILFFSLLVIIQFSLMAQTSHAVAVTSNMFSPDTLSINIGDTVVWTNSQGNHNINGLTSQFASNPESFGNNVGAGWVYSHVFTIAGAYDYQCDPHSGFGMVGQITVNEIVASRTELKGEVSGLSVYPNPAVDRFIVASETIIESISIYNVTGARILEYRDLNRTEFEISLGELSSGVYLVDVRLADNTSKISQLVKR